MGHGRRVLSPTGTLSTNGKQRDRAAATFPSPSHPVTLTPVLDVVSPDFLQAVIASWEDVEVLDVRCGRRAAGRVEEEDERGVVEVNGLDFVVQLLALGRI